MANPTTAPPPEDESPEGSAATASPNTPASLRLAEDLKTEGNDHFRAARWNEALVAYRSGLSNLPRQKKTAGHVSAGGDYLSQEAPAEEVTNREQLVSTDVRLSPALSDKLDETCAKLRAVLNANIGACYVKLGDHKLAVDACSQALIDDPQYVKALQRRAASNEIINSWSSLTAAVEDYNILLRLLPPSSSLSHDAERSLRRLKPRVEEAQKKETAEMLDKLKGLGNSILGNFGLSTDNFKMVPNEQGGYSMNFSR